jgi:periplasmic divalent cation tolerance protein
MPETDALLVMTTCADAAEADALAVALVEERAAACVNSLNPVLSTYRWEGRIEREQEVLLLIKTTTGRFAALQALIRARSSYDVPEIIALPIADGASDYLAWLESSLQP